MKSIITPSCSMSNDRMIALDAMAAERDIEIARINRDGLFSRADDLCFEDGRGNVLQAAMHCAIDGGTYTVVHDLAADRWYTVDSPRRIPASVMIEAIAQRVARNRAQRLAA
ncbi:MAG: hypothetical protein P4L33_04285 [Capsulimonadaceae bacterium]|nr:hypothetical protein [Capsulimonadaceae bacterium]